MALPRKAAALRMRPHLSYSYERPRFSSIVSSLWGRALSSHELGNYRFFVSDASSQQSAAVKQGEDFVFIGPRMPVEPVPRAKPSNAVEVVEQYIEKLWRDFFTNPYQWMDNRLKKRAPKYADFKHIITKEGIWITTKWNPLWVRVELSLMTNFKPVPFNDPIWYQKKTDIETDGRDSTRVGAQAPTFSTIGVTRTR